MADTATCQSNLSLMPKSTRRELMALVRLALPIVGAQVAAMGMGVMDSIMAGRLSSQALAGVGLGANIFWPSQVIFWGLLLAIPPIASQSHGAGRIEEIGGVIRQALWLAIFSSAIVIAVLINADQIFAALKVNPEAAALAIPYLKALSWGVPGFFVYFCLRYLAEGLGHTKPAFIIALSALALKLPLNYIFMYGKLGAPELGLVGCGVASAIVMWLECVAMIIIAGRWQIRRCGWLDRFSFPEWATIRRILSLGLPIGITNFLEIGVFSLTALLIGQFSTHIVAAHQIAITVASLTFMVPLGLGQATCIRVGFFVGSEQLAQAKKVLHIALKVSLLLSTFSAGLIFFLNHELAGLYTRDTDVIRVGAQLLLLAACFQLFDFVQVVSIGALRGYKATRFPMAANLIAYWLFALPLGYCLGNGLFGLPALGAHGFWIGLTIGLALIASSVIWRSLWLANQDERIRALSRSL